VVTHHTSQLSVHLSLWFYWNIPRYTGGVRQSRVIGHWSIRLILPWYMRFHKTRHL